MATLYFTVSSYINVALENAFPDEDMSDLMPNEEVAYRSYVKWEANGGVDLQLPSFKLKNRQMFWVCLAHKISHKYHWNEPKENDEYLRLVNDNLNIHMKLIPGFGEAFQCDRETLYDENEAKEYRRKLAAISKKQDVLYKQDSASSSAWAVKNVNTQKFISHSYNFLGCHKTLQIFLPFTVLWLFGRHFY